MKIRIKKLDGTVEPYNMQKGMKPSSVELAFLIVAGLNVKYNSEEDVYEQVPSGKGE